MIKRILAALIMICFSINMGSASAADDGFVSIFDGKTFNGWRCTDESYWSVEDAALTARGTKEHPVKKHQFMVWAQGELDDFELKLKFRIQGEPVANAGIQIRSRMDEHDLAIGYQADIDRAGTWLGCLYDEHGRKVLAKRGQRVVVEADGKITANSIGDPAELLASVNLEGWNDYHIIARGERIIIKINDRLMSDTTDLQKSERDFSGLLALQIHSGPPLTIQYKNILLKRLPLAERKKLVLIGSGPTHDYGGHEHRAGTILLTDLLNKSVPGLHTAVYPTGWPTDPTAFDNADAVVIFSDGGKAHQLTETKGDPLARMKVLDALAKKGVGIGMMHYAVIPPEGDGGADYLLDWTGGYFKTGWSVNPWWVAEIKNLPEHPTTRGVKSFTLNDEWYFNMMFPEGMKGVTPLLSAIPPDNVRNRKDSPYGGNEHVRSAKGRIEHLAWAVERADGGRGFGFTGGHLHWNWAHDDFRKFIANSLVWVSGMDVPKNGIGTPRPTLKQLQENQDFLVPKDWKPEEIQALMDGFNASK